MTGRSFSFSTSGNPLVQVLSLIVFGVLLVGAVIMGAVVLAAVLGLAVVAAVVFWIRFWWLSRKLRRPGGPLDPNMSTGSDAGAGGRLIEAEYEIIERRDTKRAADRGSE